jgi:hypothetical protein
MRTHKVSHTGEHLVREDPSNRVVDVQKPTLADLRDQCDQAIKAKHGCSRSAALRRVDMAASTFERCLRDGISDEDTKRSVLRKLDELGVLSIVPRR